MKQLNIRLCILGFFYIATCSVCNSWAIDRSAYEIRKKLGIAIPTPISQIQPLKFDDPVNRILLTNLGAGLTAVSIGGETTLDLAAEAAVSRDGKNWSFTLRRDVMFYDGELCRGANVKASLLTQATRAKQKLEHLENASHSAPTLARIANIKQVSVVPIDAPSFALSSPNERIAVQLKEPDFHFDRIAALLPILHVDVFQEFEQDAGDGTQVAFLGPYVLRENRPDEGVVLSGTRNFFRPSSPVTDNLEFRYFRTADDAMRALRVGAVDVIALPTTEQLRDAKKDPTLLVYPSPLSNYATISGSWKLIHSNWSRQGDDADALQTDQIIVRRSLKLGKGLLERFDLSRTFLP